MPEFQRENSLGVGDLRALAYDLDMQSKHDSRQASIGQEMEYVPPPTGLYSSRSRGLVRENRPRRHGAGRARSSGRSAAPSANSGHSVMSVMTTSTAYTNPSTHSVDSQAAADLGASASSFYESFDDNYSVTFMGGGSGIEIGNPQAIMPSLRRAQTATGAPPSLRRAHTTAGSTNRRGLAGKRGIRPGAGPGLRRSGTDEKVNRPGEKVNRKGPALHRASTGEMPGSPRAAPGARPRSPVAGSRGRSPVPDLQVSNHAPPLKRPVVDIGDLEVDPFNPHVLRGSSVSPVPEHKSGFAIDDDIPAAPAMSTRQTRRKHQQSDLAQKSKLEPKDQERMLGASYGSINDNSDHSRKSASSVPSTRNRHRRMQSDQPQLARSTTVSAATSNRHHRGKSDQPSLSRSSTTGGSSAPYQRARTTDPQFTRRTTSNESSNTTSSVPPPPTPLAYRATKGLSNAAPAEMTRLAPAVLSASHTGGANRDSNNDSYLSSSVISCPTTFMRSSTSDEVVAPPTTAPLAYRATKGLSAQPNPSQMTRVEPLKGYGLAPGSNHSDRSSRSRSRSPRPLPSNKRQQPQQFDLIEDDADEVQDTFVHHTQLQMTFVGGMPGALGGTQDTPAVETQPCPTDQHGLGGGTDRNDGWREKFGLSEVTDDVTLVAIAGNGDQQNLMESHRDDNPAAESRPGATAQPGLSGGAGRNDVRREKFGLSEPTDITLVASAGKGSKHDLKEESQHAPSNELETTQHSSASTQPSTAMQVGAYRVSQPRSTNQQRPGAPLPAEVSSAEPSPAENMLRPPEDSVLAVLDADRKKMKKMSTSTKAGVLGALLVIVIVIIVIAVTAGGKGDTPASEQGSDGGDEMTDLVLSTRAPVTDIETHILNLLPEETAKEIALSQLEVTGNETVAPSPPSHSVEAFNWMLEDPSLIKYSDVRLLQRFSLATLYFATNGAAWASSGHWLSFDHHECKWSEREIECDGLEGDEDNYADGLITAVKLARSRLEGYLPMELSLLTNVGFVDLSENKLKGSIPSTIGTMMNLTKFVLDENQLSGPIPSQLGLLTRLTQFSAQENALNGTLAAELGNMIDLSELVLSVNKISGVLPPSIGALTKLKRLYVDQNLLVGSLPEEMGSLAELRDLFLDRNQLGSTIPSSIGQLKSLNRLSLHSNALSGSIPTQVGAFPELVVLAMENNTLGGRIPTELSTMGTSLRTITLFANMLTGPIPDLSAFSSLSDLKLNMNKLTSTLPTSLQPAIRHLSLDQNLLTGTLHTELGLLSNLNELWMFQNRLTGTVPSELGLCSKLDRLNVDQNSLVGSLPDEINNLVMLKEFNISNTQISGVFPDAFCDIQFNDFTCSSTMCGCGDRCPCEG
ncbi:LRR receptor-like serine threonine-protein kinase At4g08850 [Seminavis robusta]|uniref:non-specific serine/threonine protein kinase n=1 Tax=Seminavis robusta TaxID=568900 RepID=A0A9N8EVJ6_9STRA|nr:LRR receptor-like serine threonine-protein kinase At4g08850 [Seminavis robusta]|eukprot:Sro1814_g299360.1 LRR receptor-like serine threonine-protein kinase At4g08850 (1363) ;mRNA; r:15262-19470